MHNLSDREGRRTREKVCSLYDSVYRSALVCNDSGEVHPELGRHKYSMLVGTFPSYCEHRYARDIFGIAKPGALSASVSPELVNVQKYLRSAAVFVSWGVC